MKFKVSSSTEAFINGQRAHYVQEVQISAFGKKIRTNIDMYGDGPIFSSKTLDAYSKVMGNPEKEVLAVMEAASKRLADSGEEVAVKDMKANVDYLTFHFSTAFNGSKAFYSVGFGYKGNEHLFELEFVDGKPTGNVSMNG